MQIMSILGERTMNQTSEEFLITPFQLKTTQKRQFHKYPNSGRVSRATRYKSID